MNLQDEWNKLPRVGDRSILAIDPGLRGSGVAYFEDGHLVRAGYVKSPEKVRTGAPAWFAMSDAIDAWAPTNPGLIVIEQQRLRPGKEKGNPQNMMELQGVVGTVLGYYHRNTITEAWYPEQWKGSVKKEVMTARILHRLTLEEFQILDAVKCAESLKHNVIDAIGIGLFHLGRLKHERLIARS